MGALSYELTAGKASVLILVVVAVILSLLLFVYLFNKVIDYIYLRKLQLHSFVGQRIMKLHYVGSVKGLDKSETTLHCSHMFLVFLLYFYFCVI